MRLRIAVGSSLALFAVTLAGPTAWLPWGGWVRGLHTVAWALPILISVLLLIASAILPTPPPEDGPPAHRPEAVALGVGLLLLLEPLLHFGLLAFLAWRWVPGAEDLLLPGPPTGAKGGLVGQVAVVCLLAPLAEELFFRGRLLPWLACHLGPWSAVSLSSLAFAIAHGSPIGCLLALAVGLVLGWLRLARRDLGACVIVHQAHNALVLLGGPLLFTSPVAPITLAIGGAVLLTLAATHGRARVWALPVGLVLIAALALALPPVLVLKDQLWATGTANILTRPASPPDPCLCLLDRERCRGRLTRQRTALLRERLDGHNSPTARTARMLLDGPVAASATATEAEFDLRAASLITKPPPPLTEAALVIGIAWPQALAAVAIEDPQAVARLLGTERTGEVIAAAHGGDRKRLLSALERAWPGRLATVLFALPPELVDPIDRRHLRMNYPDADDLVRALSPEKQQAWGNVAPPSGGTDGRLQPAEDVR